MASLGLFLNEAAFIAFACAIVGLARVVSDVRRPDGFGAATVWGASMGLTGFADGLGVLLADSDARTYFFIYAADEYLVEAMTIAFLGGSAILFGFAVAETKALRSRFPSVYLGPCTPSAWRWALAVGVTVFLMRAQLIQFGSGTFASLYSNAVSLVVFALAREASRRASSTWLWAAALLAYAEATRAAMFEFLRLMMLLPLAALILGCLVGVGSLRSLRQIPLLPAYAFLALSFAFFSAFGSGRTNADSGLARMADMAAWHDPVTSAPLALLGRMTSLNQLTQIVRLTEEAGFEGGKTLEYFTYVWIPRFLWPDKPVIAQGQWFANRLGLGGWSTSGAFSNAINMTVAGEWFLNFGWPGPIAGGLLAGLWLGLLWNAAGFRSPAPGPVAGAYAFLMLYFAWSLNVDTQALPTVLALYLVFMTLSRLERVAFGVRSPSWRRGRFRAPISSTSIARVTRNVAR